MRWPRYKRKFWFVLFAVFPLPIAIVGSRAWTEYRDYQLRRDYNAVCFHLERGDIYLGQPASEYLRMSNPCRIRTYGAYTSYDHGFVGGLGHGVTVVAKNDRLVRAYSWSCLGGETFFNGMAPFEEQTLQDMVIRRLDDEARLPTNVARRHLRSLFFR